MGGKKALLWNGNKPSSWWVWFCLPVAALSWAQSEFVVFWGSDYDPTTPPQKKTKQKNPQMDPFQTHVWTPTQQWFKVWRCCILLSYPTLVIPLQCQVWLKVSQKLRLWGWWRGREGSIPQKAPFSNKLLGCSERDAQDRPTPLTFSFCERMKKKHLRTVFILESFSAQQPSN